MRLGWHAGLAALCLTLLNAIKPLHIDDTFIYEVARQIQQNPANPYGFDIFWLQWPQPVFEELTPPVVPYWWALGLAWLPAAGFAWKIWFLPFALLLSWGLSGLLQRFAAAAAVPCLWGAMLSAVVLPGFNLMQDIPALALGVAGMRLYLHAADRNLLGGAAGAGLVLGLATQTKYTAVSILGSILIHGLLHRRKQVAVVAAAVAVLIFFGWEWTMTLRYGQGMFLGQVNHGLFWSPRGAMILPLLQTVGGVAATCAPLSMHALGTPRRLVLGASIGILLSLTAMTALTPAASGALLGALGALALLSAAAVVSREIIVRLRDSYGPKIHAALWLGAWLVIEIGVYFASAPFPAARRTIGICLVIFLISAWGAVRRSPLSRATGGALLACAVSYALVVQGVDLMEARAQREAAIWANELRRSDVDTSETVWYLGHWGFQYYAEQAGMKPLIPDESRLRAGDWVVVPSGVHRPDIVLDQDQAIELHRRSWNDSIPWTTLPGYYGGAKPFVGRRGPRLQVQIYEIQTDGIPASAWSALKLAEWARLAGGRTAAAAAPALMRILEQGDEESRRIAMRGLVELQLDPERFQGPLLRWSQDADPSIRLGAVIALSRFPGEAAAKAVREARRDPDPGVSAIAERLLSDRTESKAP